MCVTLLRLLSCFPIFISFFSFLCVTLLRLLSCFPIFISFFFWWLHFRFWFIDDWVAKSREKFDFVLNLRGHDLWSFILSQLLEGVHFTVKPFELFFQPFLYFLHFFLLDVGIFFILLSIEIHHFF